MFIKISVAWNIQLRGMCVPFRSAGNFKIYKTAVSMYTANYHMLTGSSTGLTTGYLHCVSITISSSTKFFKKVGHKFE